MKKTITISNKYNTSISPVLRKQVLKILQLEHMALYIVLCHVFSNTLIVPLTYIIAVTFVTSDNKVRMTLFQAQIQHVNLQTLHGSYMQAP